MVYYDPPKRRAAAPGSASIVDLPDELLLRIVADTDRSTLTNLRAANSAFVGVCNESLAKLNIILYIHPTTSSLRQAIQICGHPLFKQSIREIALLGKVCWRDIELVFPQIRMEKSCITAASAKGRFCPWPAALPVARDPGDRTVPTEPANFEVAYAPLLTAFGRLPNAQALSFMPAEEGPGWNQTGQKLIDSHARSCALPPSTKAQQTRYSDADAVFSLLSALEGTITSLRLDTELPFAGHIIRSLHGLRVGPARNGFVPTPLCSAEIKHLTSLDLALNVGTLKPDHALERGLIGSSAWTLQHLRLTLIPRHARAQAAESYDDLTLPPISNRFWFGPDEPINLNPDTYFQRLESLTLEYRDPPIPAKCKDVRRRVRPSCQTLDFCALLDRVRHTIQRIIIRNVLFREAPTNWLTSPEETILKIHRAVAADSGTAYPDLEHFEWRVNRFHHDRRCRSEGATARQRDCEKLFCGRYLLNSTLERYEGMARTLGAELDTGNEGVGSGFGCWDFGAAAMRAREIARGGAGQAL